MNLGRADFEMHVFERVHAGKALTDAGHPQDRSVWLFVSVGLGSRFGGHERSQLVEAA